MRTLAAVAVLLFVAACQTAPPPEMTEAEIAQIQAAVVDVMEGTLEGADQMNIDMIMAAFHPTETAFVWTARPLGYAELKERWEDWIEEIPAWESQWTETTVKVLSPDAAMFQGIYAGTRTSNSGTVRHYPANSETVLLERTPDGWRITMGGWGVGASEVVSEG